MSDPGKPDAPSSDDRWMARAIEIARTDGAMFGAVIVDPNADGGAGAVIAEARNTVFLDGDSTAHAEVNAIRKACKNKGFPLAGLTIYASAEPCPMCAGAIAWSGISRVVYGTPIEALRGGGHLQIDVPCAAILGKWPIPIAIEGPVLEKEAGAVFGL